MTDFFNKEQLLELCLLKQHTQDFTMEGPTAAYIIQYIVGTLGYDATEEEIKVAFDEMQVQYELKILVDKGYLDIDLNGNDIAYYRTIMGRKLQNARV